MSQIGWTAIPRDLLGYKEGNKMPYGQWQTLELVDLRNRILTDEGMNLEVPQEKDGKPESIVLDNALSLVSSNWVLKTAYFPAASYCYAYKPTNRTDLLDKFKEHNWFLPTMGELARIGYYVQAYYDDTLDRKFDIFKESVDCGAMTLYDNSYYSTTSKFDFNQYDRLKVYTGTIGQADANITSKEKEAMVRPICKF